MADIRDDAAGDPHVCGPGRAALAVDERAATDHQVESAHVAILAARPARPAGNQYNLEHTYIETASKGRQPWEQAIERG
jgi:hypothetical protein